MYWWGLVWICGVECDGHILANHRRSRSTRCCILGSAQDVAVSNPLEVKKHAYRQTQDGIVLSLVLHPNDVPSALAVAPLGTRYAMALVEINEEAGKALKPEPEEKTEGERAVMQAGILCNEEGFQEWLSTAYYGAWGTPHMGTAPNIPAARVVRQICAVSSRREFATNDRALARWKKLAGEYYDYQRHGA